MPLMEIDAGVQQRAQNLEPQQIEVLERFFTAPKKRLDSSTKNFVLMAL